MNKNKQLIIVAIFVLILIYVIHRNNKYSIKYHNHYSNYKRNEGFNQALHQPQTSKSGGSERLSVSVFYHKAST